MIKFLDEAYDELGRFSQRWNLMTEFFVKMKLLLGKGKEATQDLEDIYEALPERARLRMIEQMSENNESLQAPNVLDLPSCRRGRSCSLQHLHIEAS